MKQWQATSRWLWIVLALAFLARILAAMMLQYQLDHVWKRDFFIPGDAEGYWELGKSIAAGQDYSVYDPPRRVLRMPGFPLVLSGSVALFGNSFFAARIVLAFFGTLGCAAVYLLGRELFNDRAALVGTAIAAAMPTFVLFSVVMLSETLFALFMLLNLWAFAVFLRKCNSNASLASILCWAFIGGVLVTVASYVRPSWILVGFIFPAVWWICRKFSRQAALQGVVMIAGMIVSLAPWAWRNYLVTDKFVPMTLWMGASLYDGLNPQATGESEMSFFERDQLPLKMSEYEIDRHYRNAAWEFVKANPGKTMTLAYYKFVRYWKPWPNATVFRNMTVILGTLIGFSFLIGSAIAGGWTLRDSHWALVLLAGPVIYFCLIHMVFVSSLRYRLPGEYALTLLAAFYWTSRGRVEKSASTELTPAGS
ncbi:MAG: glycosyltransferase family 39 protein [Planctomycetota bacterium]|nr:glycosyltransferase family 39 protein [Planctomycetota bacterium]